MELPDLAQVSCAPAQGSWPWRESSGNAGRGVGRPPYPCPCCQPHWGLHPPPRGAFKGLSVASLASSGPFTLTLMLRIQGVPLPVPRLLSQQMPVPPRLPTPCRPPLEVQLTLKPGRQEQEGVQGSSKLGLG